MVFMSIETSKANNPSISSPLSEQNERLLGANPDLDNIELYTDRFAVPGDEYKPYDTSKNPAALYAFEDGFDSLFPANLLTSREIGKLAAESSVAVATPNNAVIATAERAEAALAKVEAARQAGTELMDSNQRAHAYSGLALHHLYSDRKDGTARAEAILPMIEDELGYATHILAHIVKVNEDRPTTADQAHQTEMTNELREKAEALAELPDAYLAPVLDEAATALHNPDLHERALAAARTHFSVEEAQPKVPLVDTDGTVKIDPSDLFD